MLTGQNGGTGSLHVGNMLGEDLQTGIDRAVEVFFLGVDDAGDHILLLDDLGISLAGDLKDLLGKLGQEQTFDAQELTVTGGTAQQAAQDVAAAVVGGMHAVAHKHDGGADVVGDDAQGHVGLGIHAALDTGELADFLGDGGHGVDLEERVNLLHDAGDTLQTHTGVDVLLLQGDIVVVTVVLKLGKDQVPELDEAVAVTAGMAVGAAGVLLAAVEVDFTAGAAGTGTVADFPEVVGLAHAEHVGGIHADLLGPDLHGLVVLLVDGDVEAILGHAQNLGDKFPGPLGGLGLEVIAEGEVAQHLKEGQVTGGEADIFDVVGADALLAGGDTGGGGSLLTGEVGLQGSHTGGNEQQGLVVFRHQGEAGQTQMLLGLEEGKIAVADLIETKMFHGE